MFDIKYELKVGHYYLDSNLRVVCIDHVANDYFVSVSDRLFNKYGKEVSTDIDIICPLDEDLFTLAGNVYGKNNQLLIALIQFFRFVKIYQENDESAISIVAIILNGHTFDSDDIDKAMKFIDERSLLETEQYTKLLDRTTKGLFKALFLIEGVGVPTSGTSFLRYKTRIDNLKKFK